MCKTCCKCFCKACKAPLSQHLQAGTFSEYMSKVENFVENRLMPAIDRPFAELLVYIKANGKFPVLLADLAATHRHWNVQLKTGFVGLYTEANVFMPNFDAAEIKASYEANGLGKMNLFVDSKANRIDVLYHAGTFNLEDLYYKELYV